MASFDRRFFLQPRADGQRGGWRGGAAPALLVGAMLVGASCGGGTSTPQVSPSASVVAAAKAAVDQYLGQVQWKAPGPAINAAAAKGKSVWVIDLNTSIPFNRIMIDSMKTALTTAGMNVSTCDGQGTPSGWKQCADQAVANKPSLIIDQSIDPGLISTNMNNAVAAGIKVIEGNIHDPSSSAGLTNGAIGGVAFPFIQVGRLMADWAIVDTSGRANAVIVTSSDVPNAADIVEQGIKPEFASRCPACKVRVVDVPVSQWATQMTSSVQAALTADSAVNYILPIYDGMGTLVGPAIRQASATNRVKIVSFNADLAPMQDLAAGRFVAADVGISVPWQGWAYADQAVRALVGEKPVVETVPIRIFNRDNVKGLTLNDASLADGSWYGPVDFRQQYKQLWGLH